MRELVVHIGLHKTGSSSIQGKLHSERAGLAEQGIHIVRAACRHPTRAVHHNIAWQLADDIRFDPAGGTIADVASEIQAIDVPIVVLSSEVFSKVPDAALERLADLAAESGRTLTVVAFVREHLSAINSRYISEVKKARHAMSFSAFVESCSDLRELRYREVFSAFAAVASRMILLPYAGGDTVPAFLRVMNARPLTGERLNTAVGPWTIEACRLRAAQGLSVGSVRKRADALGWNVQGYWGFSPELAREVQRRFAEPDADFLERHGIRFESNADRPCNEVTIGSMPTSDREALLAVAFGK